MHPHLHPKVRRFLTEPDEPNCQSQFQDKRKAMKEMKLAIYNGPQLNEINVPNLVNIGQNYQKNVKITPLHYKKVNKKAHLYKLPEISHENISSMDQIDTKTHKHPPSFKRNNPLFVLNSLFRQLEIIKEDLPGKSTTKQKISNEQQRRGKQIKSQISTITSNQFGQYEHKNARFKRPPRIVNNHMNRMTSKENFCRRKIYSEEKTRNKENKERQDIQLITFYNCSDNLGNWKQNSDKFEQKEFIFGEG